jgi:hypothetical protein
MKFREENPRHFRNFVVLLIYILSIFKHDLRPISSIQNSPILRKRELKRAWSMLNMRATASHNACSSSVGLVGRFLSLASSEKTPTLP